MWKSRGPRDSIDPSTDLSDFLHLQHQIRHSWSYSGQSLMAPSYDKAQLFSFNPRSEQQAHEVRLPKLTSEICLKGLRTGGPETKDQ